MVVVVVVVGGRGELGTGGAVDEVVEVVSTIGVLGTSGALKESVQEDSPESNKMTARTLKMIQKPTASYLLSEPFEKENGFIIGPLF